ncbi:MAG: hypothetical protein R3A13_11275 [Bdellovibrionota bacterium]
MPEIDHVVPFSVCKSHEPENLLDCLVVKHNRLEARQSFGAALFNTGLTGRSICRISW